MKYRFVPQIRILDQFFACFASYFVSRPPKWTTKVLNLLRQSRHIVSEEFAVQFAVKIAFTKPTFDSHKNWKISGLCQVACTKVVHELRTKVRENYTLLFNHHYQLYSHPFCPHLRHQSTLFHTNWDFSCFCSIFHPKKQVCGMVIHCLICSIARRIIFAHFRAKILHWDKTANKTLVWHSNSHSGPFFCIFCLWIGL